MTAPFVRESGQGEGVVCLHSNASSSAQWRDLAALLADRFRVLAADGYGAGNSPDWPAEMASSFEQELELLAPVFERVGDRFHLVGHSYGGAVAVLAALRYRQRVRSLVIYEPTLFALVSGSDPATSPAAGIWNAATEAAEFVRQSDGAAGASRFVDFWSGEGAWAAMPTPRQAAVQMAVRHVGRWRDATFMPAVPAAALVTLDVPVLLMWGERSPESSLAVARRLAAALPQVSCVPQPTLDHMGPIADPARVNAEIARFLEAHRERGSLS